MHRPMSSAIVYDPKESTCSHFYFLLFCFLFFFLVSHAAWIDFLDDFFIFVFTFASNPLTHDGSPSAIEAPCGAHPRYVTPLI